MSAALETSVGNCTHLGLLQHGTVPSRGHEQTSNFSHGLVSGYAGRFARSETNVVAVVSAIELNLADRLISSPAGSFEVYDPVAVTPSTLPLHV